MFQTMAVKTKIDSPEWVQTLCNCFYSFLFFSGLYFSVSRLISSESTKAMECSEEWIGVRRKCFYFSDDTRNWTASKRFCSSHGSELAQIDTPEDMVRKGKSFQLFWSSILYKEKKMIKANTPWLCQRGEKFPLPFYVLLADLRIQLAWDRLTRENQINYVRMRAL